MPKAYDLQRLTVTHSPTQRVDLSYAKIPIPNPLDPGPMIDKLLQAIKDATGIDLTGFDALLDGMLTQQWFKDLLALLGNPNLGDSLFDVLESAVNWLQTVLAPTGKVLTEWNLTGLFPGSGGLTLPYTLPGTLGGGLAPDTVLQRFIDNLRIFLTADYTSAGFDIIAAVTELIETRLIPTGLLAQLISGKLPDVQAPPIVGAIISAVQQLFALPGSTDLSIPLDISAVWADVLQQILAPTGLVLTEWNLTGVFPGGAGGLTLPYTLPGELSGAAAPDTPLQRFANNVKSLLTADYTDPSFDLGAAVLALINTQLLPSGLFAGFDDIQAVIDNIWRSITRLTGTGITPTQLEAAFQNFPPINIPGVGGPIDLPATLQQTWTKWVAGMVDAVGGTVGTVGLADLYNVGHEVASMSAEGRMALAIAAIRNNSGLNSGFFPTTQTNISMDKLAMGVSALPTFPITQSTAITAYHRIAQASDFALVSWQGYGNTNVSDCYVNIYKMDTTTGVNNLVHASANIAGLLGPGAVAIPIAYDLPTAVHVEPGEVFGIEIAIRGAGTHNIAGEISGLQDQLVYPRRYSSVRNSGTAAPPASFTPTYGTNVPIVEFGVTSGFVGVPHAPLLEFYPQATATRVPPPWANTIQVTIVPAAGGGRQGGFGAYGEGGHPGTSWATAAWVRGTDFTGSPTISMTNANGGAGGSSGLGFGGNAGTATAAIPGHTLSAPGGAGGAGTAFSSSISQGLAISPNPLIVDGVPYTAGATQFVTGEDGALYGGPGAGGNAALQFGGDGARSGIWLRFKQ